MRVAAALIVLAGCGRISFDGGPVPPDADATCWPLWHRGVTLEAPVLRDDVNSALNDKNPFLASDNRTLYFTSDRAGGQGNLDFWFARRDDADARFAVVGPITELDTDLAEGRLEVDSTGLVAVFSSARAGGAGANDIYLATRPDLGSPFVIEPALTAAINSSTDEKDPHFLAGSAERIYYTGGPSFRVASRSGSGAFGAGVVVDVEIAGVIARADPQPSPDERTLVFSAESTTTGFDFYVATRESVTEPFTNAVPLSAINTPKLDRDISLTADGCEVWWSTTIGPDDIYMSRVIR